MKKQLNEIKRMQQLAGLITESQLNEELELDFKEKAKVFVNKHKNIIKDAIKFYENRPDDYEYSLIETIYNFLEQELGANWTTQISAPKPEDEENYTYGWTDEKDEVFNDVLKSILEPGSSLDENQHSVSDETYGEMDNFIYTNHKDDYDNFIDSAINIINALWEKNYKVEDIFDYLNSRLEAEV